MGNLAPASSIGEQVDAVFLFILVLCVAFLVFITSLMVYFVIRYNRKRSPKGTDIEGHFWLEVTWTVVPLVLFLLMFYYGWTGYSYSRNPPRDAMGINVQGRQWAWQFEYPNGKVTDSLYLALGKPVKLDIRSNDVIHGFYVPAFRIKMDAVPGKLNTTWFEPIRLGAYDIECTVICGVDHTYMLSKAVVVPEREFREWYDGPPDAPPPGKYLLAAAAPPAPAGADGPALSILRSRTCLTCHSVDGRAMVGPTFKGLFGTKGIVVLPDGKEKDVVADEAHLRTAIQEPMAEILKGYPPTMPKVVLGEDELKQVIGFIKTLQ